MNRLKIRWAVSTGGEADSVFLELSGAAPFKFSAVAVPVAEGGEVGGGKEVGGAEGSCGAAFVACFALVRSGAPLLLKGTLELAAGSKSLVFEDGQTNIAIILNGIKIIQNNP